MESSVHEILANHVKFNFDLPNSNNQYRYLFSIPNSKIQTLNCCSEHFVCVRAHECVCARAHGGRGPWAGHVSTQKVWDIEAFQSLDFQIWETTG